MPEHAGHRHPHGLMLPDRGHGRVRHMSVRFGITAVDQSLSSLSNFAVGVAIARVTGVGGLGAYSLVYAVWLLVAAMHRSLITEPMAIENDMHKPDSALHVRVGLAAELSLGLAVGAVFAGIGVSLLALGQTDFGTCFVGLAPWLPCLLAQDYWRWVGFMKAQPQKALANDGVFDAVQVVAFAVLFIVGIHTPLLAVVAWGAGASAGALFGLHQFSCRPSIKGGLRRILLRWHLSKWLVSVDAVTAATAQATLVLAGALLGPAGIGGLKSATSLVSGPSMVLIQAGGSIGLPEATKALKERGWPGLRRVHWFITLAGMVSVGLIATIVILFGRQLLVLLYGPAFGQFATAADILAVSFFVGTISLGAILCLKATRTMRRLLPVSACSLAASVVAIVILAPLFGVLGAAFATLIGISVRTAGLLIAHWTTSRRAAESLGVPSDPVRHALEPEPSLSGAPRPVAAPRSP